MHYTIQNVIKTMKNWLIICFVPFLSIKPPLTGPSNKFCLNNIFIFFPSKSDQMDEHNDISLSKNSCCVIWSCHRWILSIQHHFQYFFYLSHFYCFIICLYCKTLQKQLILPSPWYTLSSLPALCIIIDYKLTHNI
jgi:hypothetical protein